MYVVNTDIPKFTSPSRVRKGGRHKYRALHLALLCATTAAVSLGADEAWAQSSPVSPVTVAPPTLAPDQRSDGFAVAIPEAGALQPPPGSENLSVNLGNVVVEGGFAELSDKTEAIVSPLRGRRVTLAEVYAAASAIEAEHARAGFVLARVSVPPQEIVDGGDLRIIVIDGQIADVDVSALPEQIRSATAQRVRALQGKPHVTLADMEEALSLAADLPGLALRSTLMRGAQPSTARIVLEGEQKTLTGVIGVDNELDPSLGRWGVNLQLVLNSALGFGEQVYGFAASDYDVTHFFDKRPRQRVLGGGAILPFGSGRFSLNPEVTFATTSPDAEVGVLRTRGLLRRVSMRGQAVLQKTRRRDVRLGLTVEQLDVRNDALDFATRLNHDHYVAARLGLSANLRSTAGVRTNLTLQVSKGLDGFGAITPAEAVRSGVSFSRIGANPGFEKIAGSGRVIVPLDEHFQLSLAASGQTTFGKPVFRSEQFSLEGSDALSAYLGGETAVDAGIVGRTELSYISRTAPSDGVDTVLAPYVFAAWGAGRIENPTAVERRSIRAANFGAGLRARLLDKIELTLEYARSASSAASLDDVDRIGVSAKFQF